MQGIQKLPEESAQLVPLKCVDPAVFQEDDSGQPPQPLCSFVLALALFYNDFRDAEYGRRLLQQNAPQGKYERRPDWGAHCGIETHFIRYFMGLLYELVELIKDNKDYLSEPFFRTVIDRMRLPQQQDWQGIVDVSLDRSSPNRAAQIIMVAKCIRRDIAFHYVGGSVFNGYRKCFLSPGEKNPEHEKAFLSLGDSMQKTKFYFADAAAQTYLKQYLGADPESFFRDTQEVFQAINFCILNLVQSFIDARGFKIEEVRK